MELRGAELASVKIGLRQVQQLDRGDPKISAVDVRKFISYQAKEE